jgi:hypothetical protein
MGGQACVLYGGAEFSRDADLAILADEENIERLRRALSELQAECIAVPPFEPRYLHMGLAIHFRCHHAEARRVRVDVMSRMRGVDEFQSLWPRRTTLHVGGTTVDILALPDLVKAKKTQRDKDWLMIVRLLEASYFSCRERPTAAQIEFWLRELRTPPLLVEVAGRFPTERELATGGRPLLALAAAGDQRALVGALAQEERRERDADAQYWAPLREQLSRLRQSGNP